MNVLITGGSKGIGKAIKDYFTEKGHNVLSPTRSELDLSDHQSVIWYLQESEINCTYIDIIINCAGINKLNKFEDIGIDSLNEVMFVNFNSYFRINRHFIPLMKQLEYGRILNIGSIWLDLAKISRGAYSVSKAALHAMTKQIAIEYGQYNILCNTLSPGFVETEMTYKNNSNEDIALIQKEIPQQRLAKPEEIAKLAYFLTVENSYINGQNIIIDGGYSICA